MKKPFSRLAAVVPLLAAAQSMGAITETYDFTALNRAVPDGNPAGLADTHTVASNIVSLESVEVSLSISGTFNGDLYAYLAHDSGFAVLLNRVGRTAANAFGYADDGLVITLSATAANGDIHLYQNTTVPVAGSPLTGAWQPDGRNVDPNAVTDATARTALLASFNGGVGSGDWTLFVGDVSSGDLHVLNSWGMTLTGAPVPEPGAATLLLAACGLHWLRRRRSAAKWADSLSP